MLMFFFNYLSVKMSSLKEVIVTQSNEVNVYRNSIKINRINYTVIVSNYCITFRNH